MPWAATAATKLASQLPFASFLGASSGATQETAATAIAKEPDFPLSSSDRDRLERLLSDDLDSLANLLRGNPAFSGDDEATFELALDASGEAKGSAIGSDGQPREIDLTASDEATSLLRRIASCLKRLSPADSASGDSAASAGWNIRVDHGGARLIDV